MTINVDPLFLCRSLLATQQLDTISHLVRLSPGAFGSAQHLRSTDFVDHVALAPDDVICLHKTPDPLDVTDVRKPWRKLSCLHVQRDEFLLDDAGCMP